MFRRTCGDYRVLTILRTGCGCSGHPAFPAPSDLSRAKAHAKLGRIAPRECRLASSPLSCPAKGGGIQYAAASQLDHWRLEMTEIHPPSRVMTPRIRCLTSKSERSDAHSQRRPALTPTGGGWCSASGCRARPVRGVVLSSSRWPLVVSSGTSGALPGPLWLWLSSGTGGRFWSYGLRYQRKEQR